MRNKALIVGGSNGIGLAICRQLLEKSYEKVYILDKNFPDFAFDKNVEFTQFNLINEDFSVLNNFADIDTLIITSGFGRVAPFGELIDIEIINSFKVNALAVCRIIKHFYPQISSTTENFYCAVMGSVAGLISSPLFSIYGATKAAVCKFTESVNIELEKAGSANRVLNVSPGSVKGTKFNGGANDLSQTAVLAGEIVEKMLDRQTIFIPQHDEIFKRVIADYQENSHKFGLESYDYKMSSGRFGKTPQQKIGYLSGTFDLFHIGHLNLLRRAKKYCDYLVVGVHQDAAHKGKDTFIPLEERMEIVRNVKFVDEVILSKPEDKDVWQDIKYDFLFVGSDYKGTERFLRYEEYFKDKGVEIVYFPYTQGTSSTQLRKTLE